MDFGLNKAIERYNKSCEKALNSINVPEEGPFLVAQDIPVLASRIYQGLIRRTNGSCFTIKEHEKYGCMEIPLNHMKFL